MAAQTPASGAEDAKNPPDRSRGGHEEDTEGMDCRDTEPQASKPMTIGPSSSYSGGGPTRTLNAGEEGWQTVLTLRQRKAQAKERQQQASRNGPSSEISQAQNASGNNRRRPKYRKLPPLPRDDFKVVIRPHQGLPIRSLTSPLLAEAVIEACKGHVQGEHFMLRIKPGSNIFIVSTPLQEVAERVRKLTSIVINGRPHAVNAYVATGDEAVRGVVHGIPPHTPSDTLKVNLRIRSQGVEIIQARMLGDSKTAVITFYGAFVPRYVYYQGGELACYSYKNTVQVCKLCQQVGHRTDVCPQPELQVCRTCGTLDPTEGHQCSPRCAMCGEPHLTGDRSCKKRLKPNRRLQHTNASRRNKPSSKTAPHTNSKL